MFPHETQEEIDITREKIAGDMTEEQAESEQANEKNRADVNSQSIPALQARLDALRLQSPEDDPIIAALENEIEALKKNIN
jgi:capsule polysaccharide export protein KpsE/RkpR